MSKFDIRRNLNVKIGFRMSNAIFGLNPYVKIGFECQNEIFGPNSNVKIRF